MIDPRVPIISERLRSIRRIIAVSSGKGGVGKSLVASVLALTLVKRGFKVGFFDIDFTSPSSHVILGVKEIQPEEKNGIIPPIVHGLKYMSIIHYVGDRASPLRGADFSNALIELLAVTVWGELDFLIVDMPPGISDAALDVIRLIRKAEFLVVTTPSRLAFETIRKFIDLLAELNEEAREAVHFVPEIAHTFMKCPRCGSPDFEIVTGRGIWIESIKGVKKHD